MSETSLHPGTGIESPVEPVVKLRGLSKRYGETLALDSVDLDVMPNEMFAMIGPNGAGKTTLMHILCTILKPDAGVATIAGFDVVRQPLRARKNLGVVFQEPSLDDRLTVAENLNFHGLVYQVPFRKLKSRITDMLALVELSDWRDHQVRSLSSGMKRRLEIARALIHEPKIIFLDEPTVGLDVQSRARIWSYLDALRRQQDLTIIVTTHHLEEVDACDRVCVIDHGKILAQGSPSQLKDTLGEQLVRVTPIDDAAAARILAHYPSAIKTGTAEITLIRTDDSFVPEFLHVFGNQVAAFTVDRPSLESVFLSLTGRALRDQGASARDKTLAFGRRGGEHTR